MDSLFSMPALFTRMSTLPFTLLAMSLTVFMSSRSPCDATTSVSVKLRAAAVCLLPVTGSHS